MAVSLFNSVANAQGPSNKPDWSEIEHYSVMLSSHKLEFSVPGKLSPDFEFQAPANSNIYDEGLYGSWPSFTLSSMYWDYKTSKLLWTDLYGSMRMHVIIQKNPDKVIVNNLEQSKQALTKNLREIYGINDGHFKDDSGLEIPDYYDTVSINNNDWLTFNIPGGNSNEDKIAYATQLGDSHSIEVYFSILESKPRNHKDWFNVCKQDIDRIIKSFNLQLISN